MFSQKVIQRQDSLKFYKKSDLFKKEFKVQAQLNELKVDVVVEFNTKQEDELLITDLSFDTTLSGEYLAVMDAFFEIINNKPLEAIDRVSIKELDYFLRDENSTPAFKFYNKELYEILSIGEDLQKAGLPKKEEYSLVHNPELQGDYFDLSFSEQIELIEEVSAKHFYNDLNFRGLYLECDDIDDRVIQLIVDEHFMDRIDLIKAQLIKELCLSDCKFEITYTQS